MRAAQSLRGRSPVDRYLPVVYLGLSVGLAAAFLPTALRPPPDAPPTSAQLSPDAPPDESDEVLLSELGRGTTSTAGSGPLGGSADELDVPAPAVQLRPRKGKCFGDPPRQTESIYSPPCVPAFTGNNGGATWRGVTGDEIRWAIVRGEGYEGPIDQRNPDFESNNDRTWRVWEQYLNDSFELYGRRLRFFMVNSGAANFQESSNSRASVEKADQEYGVFGITVNTTATPAEDEGMKRKLVTFGGSHKNIDKYRENDPYAWSFQMDGTKLVLLSAELICKQLWGKPVSFSGDPLMQGQPRKFAYIQYNDATYTGYSKQLEDGLSKCGARVDDIQYYNWDDSADQLATVITKLRAQGVTTIRCGCDATAPIVFTRAADQQGYFPEWVHTGSGGIDLNSNGANYSRTQWANSIGFSSNEMNGARINGSDGYRAYKAVDPDGEPDGGGFDVALQVAGGLQLAGPNLTPNTFKEGLIERWPSRPPDPIWSIGGGYGPGDWTYSDYVSLMSWDPNVSSARIVHVTRGLPVRLRRQAVRARGAADGADPVVRGLDHPASRGGAGLENR